MASAVGLSCLGSLVLLLLQPAVAGDINVTVLVVGKVSQNSANVLLEVEGASSAVSAMCTAAPQAVLRLRDDGGAYYTARRSVNCTWLASRRPVPFFFDGLPASTVFSVELAAGISRRTPARVVTHGTAGAVTLGVISCNKITLRMEEVSESEDLWEPLSEMVRSRQLSGALHIGDQVYIDNDRFVLQSGDDNGRDAATIRATCPYCRAEDLLASVPGADWSLHAEAIRETFRDVYRETWSHGPTAYVLANTMNLFVADDHEVRDDLGDNPDDRDPASLHFFLSKLAFEVAWEYQYELMGPWEEPLQQAYHDHVVAGSVGMVFLDVRVHRSVLYMPGSRADQAKLQDRQWADLRAALSPGGSMSNVTVLLAVSPLPLVYTSKAANTLLSAASDDFEGAWAVFEEEQSALLDALRAWQSEVPGRQVMLVSGDVHHGGHTAVYADDSDEPVFGQLSASSIMNRVITGSEATALSAAQNLYEQLLRYSYRHYGWTYDRNFGTISFLPPGANATGAGLVQRIYVSDGAGGAAEFSAYQNGVTDPGTNTWQVWLAVVCAALSCCCCSGCLCCCHLYRRRRRKSKETIVISVRGLGP